MEPVPGLCRACLESARQPEPAGEHVAGADRTREQRGIDHDVEGAADSLDECPPEGLAGDGIAAFRRLDDLAGNEGVRLRRRDGLAGRGDEPGRNERS